MKLRFWRQALAGVLLLAPLGMATTAQAIPGDGAGTDTPGTNSSVSPRALTAGSTINFSVSGFPAGQFVNIKIDDGLFCSDAGVHGACVVHVQKISSAGTASGSFVLPSDLKPGKHWLRYLSSEPIPDRPGASKGYTRRGGSEFTVVAGGTPASTGESGNSGSNTGSNPASTGGQGPAGAGAATSDTATTAGDSGAQPTQGSEPLTPVASPGAEITLQAGPNQPTAEPTVAASAAATSASEVVEAAPTTAVSSSRQIPWLGIGGGVVLLVAAALLLLLPRRRGQV